MVPSSKHLGKLGTVARKASKPHRYTHGIKHRFRVLIPDPDPLRGRRPPCSVQGDACSAPNFPTKGETLFCSSRTNFTCVLFACKEGKLSTRNRIVPADWRSKMGLLECNKFPNLCNASAGKNYAFKMSSKWAKKKVFSFLPASSKILHKT